ncbi:MAG TPA: BTAD domain-containing putative transcriptional regulator, partial [Gaiellaceae bacterium]|nr:BTAD domain-containing putative transcriptional regulator [Gaiellaceae bacterium]
MEFGILGPLEVTSDGRSLDLGGAKQRSLLAVLLLNANEVVSHDRLIDALWEDQPPESAQKALQVYVSGLRKAIGRDRLQTKAPGYLLRVHAGELDLGRFSALQREGRPAEALSLWRGPPLSDFAYQRFAQAEIGRLEELRLACLEEWVEQRLQARPGGELVGELEALVSEQPLRERLRAQLMLALYRSGRQAEALAAFQEARRALVDELGIEPGRELRELHQAILNQDPTLDLPLPEPAVESDRHRDSPSAEPPREPAREVRKTVTALAVAVDVSSADERPVDPEALRRVTTRAFGVVRDAVERHGGVLETPAGNAVTAVFGLPAVHEDDAARAARAAEEARELLAAISSELPAGRILEVRFRIGISTGEVLAGGGREAPLGAVGEPLTRASALAQAARAGEIAVDDATRRRLRETPRRVSPMIGRERERRRLRDAFDQAVGDGCCQLFTVLGAAGVGKSRLVEEFLAEVGGAARVVRGRCLPYGDGITYWPVLEAVKDGVGLADADSPAEAREKLLRAVDGEPAADTIAQRLSEVLGLADTATPVEEVFAAVQTLFVTLARVGPLVVVFDDVHWGEPTFLELVEYLAERTRDVPLLLVCLARPELFDSRPAWAGGKLNATTALLEPLSDDQSLQLVGNLAGASALDAGARGRIVAAAEGNPLFVEEMLALALEEDGSTDELVVPPTIQALLAARLDRLPDDERAALDRAAVQGKVFYADAVAALAPLAAAVSSCLGALVRKELIRPERPSFGGDTYRFRHLLIRDAAYDSIPKEARADLHERFARWLEEAAGERAAEYEEIVGYHLEQGFRYRQELGQVDDSARRLAGEAADRLGAAGRRAFV